MKLWLVRHGQTHANLAGVYSGISETGLTELGVSQATSVGTMLRAVPFDRVLCSERGRARHSTQLILQQPLPVITEPRLNEMNFGDWEMQHHRDIQLADAENYAAWCRDWQNVIPTNGEGFQFFAARVKSFKDSLNSAPLHDNVLIVSHQGVLSLLIALLLEMPAASLWHFMIEQGAWSMIEINEQFATLKTLNNRADALPLAEARQT